MGGLVGAAAAAAAKARAYSRLMGDGVRGLRRLATVTNGASPILAPRTHEPSTTETYTR